jgi:hypothetical protein
MPQEFWPPGWPKTRKGRDLYQAGDQMGAGKRSIPLLLCRAFVQSMVLCRGLEDGRCSGSGTRLQKSVVSAPQSLNTLPDEGLQTIDRNLEVGCSLETRA